MELEVKDFKNKIEYNIPTVIHYAVLQTIFNRYPFGYTIFYHLHRNKNASIVLAKVAKLKEYCKKFKEFKKFDDPIPVFPSLTIYKDSHKMALAMFFELEKIPVVYKHRGEEPDFSLDFLSRNDFPSWQINELEKIISGIQSKK